MSDIFIFSGVPYDLRNQRPQHMARFFASRGHNVFYISITDKLTIEQLMKVNSYESFCRELFIKNKDEVFLLNRKYDKFDDENNLNKLTNKIEEIFKFTSLTYIITFPHWINFFSSFPSNCKLIYDCLDDWESFILDVKFDYDERLIYDEAKLASIADLVIVSAKRLYTKMSYFNNNLYYLPNGVWNKDYTLDKFNDDIPLDLNNIDDPIVFFMGSVAEWVDINLIDFLAKSRPKYSYVFVGDQRVGLPSKSNVHFLGVKRYEELSKYLNKSRVAIVPFKENNLTAAVTPLKLYEYLSSGTPVVSTILPDIINLEGLRIGENYSRFLENIDYYVTLNDEDYESECNKALVTAKQFDWNKLLESLCGYIRHGTIKKESNEQFLEQIVNEYKNYEQNQLIKNELLGIYTRLGQYQNALDLYQYNDIKEINANLDYEKLALAYLKEGNLSNAIECTRLYFQSIDKVLLNTYLDSLLNENNKGILLEVFLLKLSGNKYDAFNKIDLLINNDKDNVKALGLLTGLYLDIGEYDTAFHVAADIIHNNEKYKLEELFDFYTIKFIIDMLIKNKQYNYAEEIALLLTTIDSIWEEEAVRLLSSIYLEKYKG